MFTGLVQAVAQVTAHADGRLVVEAPSGAWDDPFQVGESVAINGVCLTSLNDTGPLQFDLSPETYARTALDALAVGDVVNLERALRLGDRLGGHLVQGHVDATGAIFRLAALPDEMWNVTIQGPKSGARFLMDKGSVTVDGISLTVIEPDDAGRFSVAIIPHTWENTNLQHAFPGKRVNLEFDMLAKQVERLLMFSPPAS
jgi:riboflavin synthase